VENKKGKIPAGSRHCRELGVIGLKTQEQLQKKYNMVIRFQLPRAPRGDGGGKELI